MQQRVHATVSVAVDGREYGDDESEARIYYQDESIGVWFAVPVAESTLGYHVLSVYFGSPSKLLIIKS